MQDEIEKEMKFGIGRQKDAASRLNKDVDDAVDKVARNM